MHIEETEGAQHHRQRTEAALADEHESAREHREHTEDAFEDEHESAQRYRDRSEKMQEALAVAGVAIAAVVLGEISITIAAAVQPDGSGWERATAETAAWMVTVGFISIPFWMWAFWSESPWSSKTSICGAMVGLWFGSALGVAEHFITKLSWPPQIASPLLADLIPLRLVLLLILGMSLGMPMTALFFKWSGIPELSSRKWALMIFVGTVLGVIVALVLHIGMPV